MRPSGSIFLSQEHIQIRTDIRTGLRRVPLRLSLTSAAVLLIGGLDVPAKPPLRGDVLYVADCNPYVPGIETRSKGIRRGPSADTGQDQGSGKHPGVARPEFVVHQPPEITCPHG